MLSLMTFICNNHLTISPKSSYLVPIIPADVSYRKTKKKQAVSSTSALIQEH